MSLLVYIARNKLKAIDVMNALQAANVISDECVGILDVAPADHAAAIAFLEGTK